MTVSAQTTYNTSIGNGVTTVFPFTFKITDADDLKVIVDGVEVSTGFTVAGVGNEGGGNVTFSTAPASGAEVVRIRDMSITRATDYQEGGDLLAETLDADIDRAFLVMQQINEAVGRSYKQAEGSGVAPTFPAIEPLKFVRANETGTALEFVESDPNDADPDSFAQATLNGSERVAIKQSGGWFRSSFSSLADWCLKTYSGFTQSGTGAVARTIQDRLRESVSVKDFGAVGDGLTACDSAFASAFAECKASKRPLYIPAGVYKFTSTSTTVWDVTGNESGGVVIFGDGPGVTELNFSGVSSLIGLHIYGSTDWYDTQIGGFKVTGSTSSALVVIGKNDFSDPCNTAKFDGLVCLNSSNDANAEGLRLNYVVNSNFIGCRANCYADGSGDNRGVALRCRQAAFNTFTNGSYGNAEFGVRFTDGYSYGNVFNAIDVENVDYCVSTDSSNAGNNTFVGGQFSLWENAAFRTTGAISTNAITVINFNSGDDDSDPVIDPTNFAGIRIIDGTGVATPSVPASTVTQANITGKKIIVTFWGGTVTGCTVSGLSIAVTSGSVVVPHGGNISLTYSSAPSWQWQPID